MNKVRFFVTLLTALLLTATFSFAHDEGEAKHKLKFKLHGDGDAVVLEDMEIGETRQFYTDSGKEVVATRTEDGYELSVDGREINVVSPGDHHGAAIVEIEGEGEEGEDDVQVFVKKIVTGGDGEANVFVMSGEDEYEWHEAGEGEGRHVWVMGGPGEGEHVSVFVKRQDVLSQVLESGVLDDLDEAKREEIVKVIQEAEGEGHHKIRTRIKRVVKDKEDE